MPSVAIFADIKNSAIMLVKKLVEVNKIKIMYLNVIFTLISQSNEIANFW